MERAELLKEKYKLIKTENGYEIWENGFWRVYIDTETRREMDKHRF